MMYAKPSPPLVPAGTEPLDTAEHLEFARIMDNLRRVAIAPQLHDVMEAAPELPACAPSKLAA
jgi:hypothetical protein